ncbi:oligosaccharide flippase family protein [Candidatus Dependentiae bacterium]|nr:oligosaccharide flippase family protein [Candidatus Dependentiae bacterium]
MKQYKKRTNEKKLTQEVQVDFKKKTIIDSILMLSGSIIGRIFNTVRGFLIAKFLGPELLGIWSSLFVILTYIMGFDFGLNTEFSRSYPKARARNNVIECEKLMNVTFTFNFFFGLIFSIFIFIYLFTFGQTASPIYKLGIILIGILIITIRVYGFFSIAIRALDDFKSLVKISIFFSAVNLLFAVPLTYFFKLKGLYLAVITTYIVSLIFIRLIKHVKFRFDFDVKKMFKMIIPGISLMLISYSNILIRNIDKTFILMYLTKTDLGYYHFSITLTSFLLMLPITIGVTLFPKMSFKYGKLKNIYEMTNIVYKPTLGFSYILMFLTGYAYILFPFLVKSFLPKYLNSIEPFLIITFGLFFYSISMVLGNFLIVIHRQIDIIKIYIISIIVCIITDYVILLMGFGINGVSYGTSLTYLLYGIGVIFFTLKYISKTRKEAIKKFFNISLPFIILFLSLLIIHSVECIYKLNGYLIYLQRSILFTIITVPFGLYYYFYRYRKEFK